VGDGSSGDEGLGTIVSMHQSGLGVGVGSGLSGFGDVLEGSCALCFGVGCGC
jgi:hypothetical protein